MDDRDIDFVDYLARRIDDFEASEDASCKNRERAERDVDYYDGKQLTEEEHEALRKRGQPPIAFNLVRQKIDYQLGLERAQRTDPRCLPRNPGDEDDANSATDALRYIKDDNRYDQSRSAAWADIIKAGWGGIEVGAEEVKNPKPGRPAIKVTMRRCAWDRVFADPYSAEPDYSDASYLGVIVWMDRARAIRMYGEGADKVFDETVTLGSVGGTYDDRPKNISWVQQGKRRRIRVVQMYHLDVSTGKWMYCVFTRGGILQHMESPWLDEDGNTEHPYVWRSAYIDRDLNRYGTIRDLIDPQDEVNKRRSKALHHFTTRQTFGTAEARGATSVKEIRAQLAKPDGHVDLPPTAVWGQNFGIVPTGDQSAGHYELLQQATAVFESMGPNASMQGKSSKDQSGRAILAEQQGGAIQLGPLTDTLKDMDFEVYRKAWNRVRQFWTGETWVRVTDDEKNLKWVGLNAPAMQEMVDPMTGQVVQVPQIDPETGQPVIQNAVAELDVDIIIDDAPEVGTLQQEEFSSLAELAKAGFPISPRTIIKASSLRSKGEILREMDEEKQQQGGPPPELQLKQAELQMQAEARQQEVQAEIEAMRAKAAAEIEIMAQKAQAQIEIERMKAMSQMQIARESAAMAQPTYQ